MDRLKKIITKQLLGDCPEEERNELEKWLSQGEANQKLFTELNSGDFLKHAVGDRNKELRLRTWKEIERRTIGRRSLGFKLRWVQVAAAVLVIGLAGWSVWLLKSERTVPAVQEADGQIHSGSSRAIVELADGQQIFLFNDTTLAVDHQGVQLRNTKDTLSIIGNPSSGAEETEFHIIRIPRGGEYIARLEDGSVVHLNAGSELRIPVNFGVDSRQVWLKGEAFFDVAHDKKRVFTVHTDKADISVLGTEFDVRAYEDEKEMITTLVQGAVKVSNDRETDRLKPGYQARVSAAGQISTEKVDVYPFIAWKTGRMVFENAPLEQIMTELQRWYDFEVFYANPGVKEMHFTIDILKYDDISKILNLMEKMQKVTFTQNGRTVVLSSR